MSRDVCVYCASSRLTDPAFLDAARRLGAHLAGHGIGVIYGGGALGSMGAVADGALAAGGRVVGILPSFMNDLEWGHTGISELRIVADMHERKRTMIAGAGAVVALPGGCGTLEELLEAITWKRLGLFNAPIVIVNLRGFFDPLLAQLARCIHERFMDERHGSLWSVVDDPEDVVAAIEAAPRWGEDARAFAVP
jgi:uncharacterized protein (TIGR00730 family)